jgi:hypothetical protein
MLCWENYVLLARYTLIAQGCEFLISPTQDIGPAWASHMSSMAKEAGVSGAANCVKCCEFWFLGVSSNPMFPAINTPHVPLHSWPAAPCPCWAFLSRILGGGDGSRFPRG